MKREKALKRVTDGSGATDCYRFDDCLVTALSNDPEDLRAMIGALLLERDAEARRPWWRRFFGTVK